MDRCDPQLLSAYFDGDLTPDLRAGVEAHLAVCEVCRAHLKQFSAASLLIQRYPFEPLNQQELSRVHDAIEEADDPSVWRLGLMMAAMAASVLIVAGAWLMELPGAGGSKLPGPVAAAPEPWERVAMTLQVDPLASPAPESIQVADADVARWMLDGLSGANR
jgi:anti-sigma factor RsiW